MDPKAIIEAALLTAGQPLSCDRLLALFEDNERPARDQLRAWLDELQEEWRSRSVELVEVSSGYRFQARQDLSPWIARLTDERRPRYSRALMETLALIAYRQPITRAEIEDVRGVAVSTHIIKTLTDREWIRVVGHRDVPGRPALFGTTRQFLDQFNLKSLSELPPLTELSSLALAQGDLDLDEEAAADDGEGRVVTAHDDVDPGIDPGDDDNAAAADQEAVPGADERADADDGDEEGTRADRRSVTLETAYGSPSASHG